MKYLYITLFIITLIYTTILPADAQLIIYPPEDEPEIVIYSEEMDYYFYSDGSEVVVNNVAANSQDYINNSIALTTSAYTNWGYGSGENSYNQAIMDSIEKKWGNYQLPISPVLIKATIAIESSFKAEAVSPTGYVGLMQLGTTEATQGGLSLKPCDERYNPEKNISAGLNTLKIKHGVIINPLGLYSDKPWAIRVNKFYQEHGYPTVYQQWVLTLAAYNGGGATVVRAMDYAISEGKDPRDWNNLICQSSPTKSPLYRAIVDVFSSRYALEKYYQMEVYPTKILNLAQVF